MSKGQALPPTSGRSFRSLSIPVCHQIRSPPKPMSRLCRSNTHGPWMEEEEGWAARKGSGRVLPRPFPAQSSSTSSTQRRPKRYRSLSRPLITAPVWQSHAPVAQPPTHHGSMDTQSRSLAVSVHYFVHYGYNIAPPDFPLKSFPCFPLTQPCPRCENPRSFDFVRRHRLRKHLVRRFCGPTQADINIPRIFNLTNPPIVPDTIWFRAVYGVQIR